MNLYNIYFSATGRAKEIADIVAKTDNEGVIDIDLSRQDFDRTKYDFTPEDLCLAAVSVYEGRVPKPARERLARLKGNGAGVVLLAVYGARAIDDCLIEMYDILTRAGFVPVAGMEAVAQHSIITSIAADRPSQKDKEEIKSFAAKVHNQLMARLAEKGREFSYAGYMEGKTLPLPGNRPYVDMGGLPLHPKGNKKCISCGICAKNCPVGAISKENPRATDGKKCITCMRCVKLCPTHARDFNPLLVKVAGMAMKKRFAGEKTNKLYMAE